ncbi:hypothetical protein [Kangiella sediminilitoris]|uniref:Uncharacterized protein n=1 Tax=Kangiella sediminilitoris TaxID=1144748 RepID=A0A1B3BDE9_9GAMM|nr:hypothetical protein [Kangiella sediminilitoris]AOE50846.1 hypothetical protein KS2013_2141 [Kangiella sediminilitoris]
MYKKLIVSLLFVALVVGIIFAVFPEKDCGDRASGSEAEREIKTMLKAELVKQETAIEVEKELREARGETFQIVDTGNKKKEENPDHASNGNEEALVKYDGDYRNDLLTRFMQDDFEQFMEEKNLQVNNVQCEDAVCDIDFYSAVPLNNNENLRNDLILDIAIKLQSEGMLSEQNRISDSENNFENIRFSVRMDGEGN